VYVGQHFEVRDHDEPVKYVFNGSTRVARISGTLANTQRVQRFHVHAGWNLLSVALTITNSLHRITNSLPGMVGSQSVFRWDDATTSWKMLPPGQTLQPGSVLWVRSTHDGSLALLETIQIQVIV
jgi:hypothetical protein